MSQSMRSRSVWRASASRLLIVDSSRSIWPRLSWSTADASGRGAASSVSTATRIAATGVRSWCDTCDENERSRSSSSSMRVWLSTSAERSESSSSIPVGSGGGSLLLGREPAHSLSSSIGRLRRLATSTPTAAATVRITAPPRPAAPAIGSSASCSRCSAPRSARRAAGAPVSALTGTAATRSPST